MRLPWPTDSEDPTDQLRAAVGVVLIAIAAAAVLVVLVVRHRPVQIAAPVRTDVSASLPAAPSTSALVTVDVEGKVHHPGLVQLVQGSRVSDAVRAAGGPLAGVSLAGLNLARKLVDGEQIVVGSSSAPTATSAAQPGGLVNLNTATLADLDNLPGVGPVMAQRILDWRTAHGHFATVDQLREIEGIGDRTFARLKELVTV